MLDRPLVLATKNDGKIREFKALLGHSGIELKSLKNYGPLPAVVEDGETFEENAYKKASTMAKVLGCPALADDSGLKVHALGGLPGVQSARYAGKDATDMANNLKLLETMRCMTDRKASFECVIAIAVPGGPALIYEGRCEGKIAHEPKGENGFGYDPVFYFPPMKMTFAEMSPETKNRVSHRGKAMSELKQELEKVLIWLKQRLAEEPF
jgi:XTP/dITP diphosphohydrolase